VRKNFPDFFVLSVAITSAAGTVCGALAAKAHDQFTGHMAPVGHSKWLTISA
jgi:hypothetical protein